MVLRVDRPRAPLQPPVHHLVPHREPLCQGGAVGDDDEDGFAGGVEAEQQRGDGVGGGSMSRSVAVMSESTPSVTARLVREW
jgi:hypothetical protein